MRKWLNHIDYTVVVYVDVFQVTFHFHLQNNSASSIAVKRLKEL